MPQRSTALTRYLRETGMNVSRNVQDLFGTTEAAVVSQLDPTPNREGAHTVLPAYVEVNRTPSAARRSIFGVWICVCPKENRMCGLAGILGDGAKSDAILQAMATSLAVGARAATWKASAVAESLRRPMTIDSYRLCLPMIQSVLRSQPREFRR